MNLKPIKQNMNEVETDRYIVLFSYKTPVAYIDKSSGKYFKTSKFWSQTTSRHITQWKKESLAGLHLDIVLEDVDQESLDNLLNEVK